MDPQGPIGLQGFDWIRWPDEFEWPRCIRMAPMHSKARCIRMAPMARQEPSPTLRKSTTDRLNIKIGTLTTCNDSNVEGS